jgi:hypothetical protein
MKKETDLFKYIKFINLTDQEVKLDDLINIKFEDNSCASISPLQNSQVRLTQGNLHIRGEYIIHFVEDIGIYTRYFIFIYNGRNIRFFSGIDMIE